MLKRLIHTHTKNEKKNIDFFHFFCVYESFQHSAGAELLLLLLLVVLLTAGAGGASAACVLLARAAGGGPPVQVAGGTPPVRAVRRGWLTGFFIILCMVSRLCLNK